MIKFYDKHFNDKFIMIKILWYNFTIINISRKNQLKKYCYLSIDPLTYLPSYGAIFQPNL